jgi:CheY-like chemotaxis protein
MKSVLIVEDDRMLLRAYERGFAACGVPTMLAESIEEAVELIFTEGEEIGCIVLDGNVPRKPGEKPSNTLPFLASLLENPRTQDIPVISCSADTHRVIEMINAGCKKGIVKGTSNIVDEVISLLPSNKKENDG